MNYFKIETKQGEAVAFVEAHSRRDVEIYLAKRDDLPMSVKAESKIIEDAAGFERNQVTRNAQLFEEMGHPREKARAMARGRSLTDAGDKSIPVVAIPMQEELSYRKQETSTSTKFNERQINLKG